MSHHMFIGGAGRVSPAIVSANRDSLTPSLDTHMCQNKQDLVFLLQNPSSIDKTNCMWLTFAVSFKDSYCNSSGN